MCLNIKSNLRRSFGNWAEKAGNDMQEPLLQEIRHYILFKLYRNYYQGFLLQIHILIFSFENVDFINKFTSWLLLAPMPLQRKRPLKVFKSKGFLTILKSTAKPILFFILTCYTSLTGLVGPLYFLQKFMFQRLSWLLSRLSLFKFLK